MLLCISCSIVEFPIRSYIVLHNATNLSSDIEGKQISGYFEYGFQLTKFCNNFKSFMSDSIINKIRIYRIKIKKLKN